MKSRGITLTELMIVLSIIGILAVALGFSYVGWQGAYKVEKQTKEIYADLMSVRGLAMSRNRMFFARSVTPFTSYALYDDTNPGPNGDGVLQTTLDTLLFTKTVEYPLTWGDPTGLGRIQFHKDGLIDTSADGTTGPWTIHISSTSDPDNDCLVISPTRINMGKWNTTTGVCDAK